MTAMVGKIPAKHDYTFYTGTEYYKVLAKQIAQTKPGDRIMLASLWIQPKEAPIADIVQELCAAAKRKVQVVLLVDAFTLLIRGGIVPGPAYIHTSLLTKTFKVRMQALKAIEQAGGQCAIINKTKRPFASPFRGRSHIKYSVVNDTVFLGGANLGDTEFIDVMVSLDDKRIADWLTEFTHDVMKSGNVLETMRGKDLALPVDASTTLLVDAGKVGQSIILDKAFDLIDEAQKRLLITYQYFPHGPTFTHLAAAVKRGVELRAYYNHPSVHPLPLNVIYGTLARKARRKGSIEFSRNRLTRKDVYLHAKVVSTEQAAILSSHNYMITGLDYGTAEIGLLSTDPTFVKEVTRTVDKQLELL